MKLILITIIAALLVVGCGPPKPPDISIKDAITKGNIEAVKKHIAAGTDVNAKGKSGSTPLHYAGFGPKETVELLIDAGADVNAKDGRGKTPLHIAAGGGKMEVVELLIAKGADVNAKAGHAGRTPLDWAIQLDEAETADLLRKHGGKTGAELKAEGK